MAVQTYSEVFEAINETYSPLAMAKLYELKAACERAGFTVSDPQDISADEYQWTLPVWFDSELTRGADVTISVEEERAHDGGEGFGLNFVLEVCDSDGMMIGSFQPYNYSRFVWVDARDADAVKERWGELDQVMPNVVVTALVGRRGQ